ncbi:MAG: hypothetical protein Q8Q56_00305, partial [Alphaproteobacteria bacterium]|nr:hypothetical protein [Alphaproteobacteria bacterium]
IRLIHRTTPDRSLQAVTLNLPVPPVDCFMSGQEPRGRSFLVDSERAPKCFGYDITYSNDKKFVEFLNKYGHALDYERDYELDDFFHSKYAHSEQALAAYLHEDAQRCIKPKPGQRCLLAEAVDIAVLCTTEIFNVNIVSIPNTVCVRCAQTLYSGQFVDAYNKYLQTVCSARGLPFTPMKPLIQASSLSAFPGFCLVSCAVSQAPVLRWENIYGEGRNKGLAAHKIPEDQTTGIKTIATITDRCAAKMNRFK